MLKSELKGQAIQFAMRIRSIAASIKSEGDDYDMQWHKSYCKQLIDVCDNFLNKISSRRRT